MKWFNVGFCFVLAILLSVAMYCLNYGYFPAPQSPKAPKFPDTTYFDQGVYAPLQNSVVDQARAMVNYAAKPSSSPAQMQIAAPIAPSQLDSDDYRKKMEQYRKDMAQYEKENKSFMKEKYLPYLKDTVNRSIMIIVLVEVLAVLLMKFVSVTVGGAYAFSGFLGFFGWVFGGLMAIPFYFFSIFSSSLDTEIKIKEYLLIVCFTALFGALLLTIIGVILVENRIRLNLRFMKYTPPPPPPLPQ